MKALFLLAFLSLGFFGCEKEEDPSVSGNFTGVFYRTSPNSTWTQSQVSLNLNANSFSGQSADARYPAICHGSWTAGEETIEFSNSCIWTADFDWTLILDGEYNYELNGDHLKIWKITGDKTDTYDLHRQ
jgi:hypothetical protein